MSEQAESSAPQTQPHTAGTRAELRRKRAERIRKMEQEQEKADLYRAVKKAKISGGKQYLRRQKLQEKKEFKQQVAQARKANQITWFAKEHGLDVKAAESLFSARERFDSACKRYFKLRKDRKADQSLVEQAEEEYAKSLDELERLEDTCQIPEEKRHVLRIGPSY